MGFAAGAGKTTRLLERAQGLLAAGRDVVVGFAETHGRAGPAALLDGLPVVPRRRVEYRGIAIEEMDLGAILRRAPEVCVVDDVAHTNVPGSDNLRRHADVETLLEAGVAVLAALDVEHVESVVPLVRSAAGRTVRETVPDAFLRRADDVSCVDVGVDELLARYRAGRVVPPERVDEALASLPSPSGLRALREMALREVAEALSGPARASAGGPAAAAAQRVSGRVLVCLASASPRAVPMIRRGARIAGRLNADWFVVHVETPAEARERIDTAEQRELLRADALARDLGAEVSILRSGDPVAAVVDFARSHGVAHVIVGRTGRGGLVRVFHRTFVDRLIDAAHDLDVHVVAADLPEDAA